MQAFKQSGAALAVSLFMLGMLTLIGVAAITSGNVNFRLVSNAQTQQEVEKAAQTAMEAYLSDAMPFGKAGATCDPAPQTMTVNGLAVTVDIEEPICYGSVPTPVANIDKDTEKEKIATRDATWEVRATVQDTASSARFIGRWGITARLLTECPAVRSYIPCPPSKP